jgi:hypothetical protein
MIDLNTALIGLSVASLTYGALSLTHAGVRTVAATRKRVGGLTFFRIGRYQVSVCKPRPAASVAAARMAAVTKRAQSTQARRLDAIAAAWCNG